jgi:hypothetical protein
VRRGCKQARALLFFVRFSPWLSRVSESALLPPPNKTQGLSVGCRSFSSADECVFYSIHKMTVSFSQLIEKKGRAIFLLDTKLRFSEARCEHSGGPATSCAKWYKDLRNPKPEPRIEWCRAKVNAPFGALCAPAVRLCSKLSILDHQTKTCPSQLFTCCSLSATAFPNRIPPPVFSRRLKES